ncbi:MAG: hypothetical protein IJX47_01090 [Clostridia bacterium]|nr:hypothetical protein [Clostridia bacterium]
MRLYLTRLTLPDAPSLRHRLLSEGAYRLLSWALADAGRDPAVLTLRRTAEGKPYLTRLDGTSVGAEFSLSHSGCWAACALADAPNAPVGVDLERIRAVSPALWRRYLAETPDEPMGDDYTAILRWTRYEAALKREGRAPAPMPPADAFCTLRPIPGYLLTAIGEDVTSVCFVSERAIDKAIIIK